MADFRTVLIQLESLGLTDLLIPFLLIFSVVYAILNTIKIFQKNINLVISLVISLLTVIPHVTKQYPKCYDVVTIINSASPKIALVVIASVAFLLVIGLFGLKLNFFDKFLPYLAIGMLLVTAYSFFTSGGAGCTAPWGIRLPNIDMGLLVPIVIIIAIILFAISGKETPPSAPKEKKPSRKEEGPYGLGR